MVMGMKHIDKIAREKNRDVLFVSFEPEVRKAPYYAAPNHVYYGDTSWESDTNRAEFIHWLEERYVGYEPVAHFACESGFRAYNGCIYVDVPFDESDRRYEMVRHHLEHGDGQPRNPRVKFWVCALEDALKNAHHDEPGFWENWADNF
jgi:hypothetical protein